MNLDQLNPDGLRYVPAGHLQSSVNLQAMPVLTPEMHHLGDLAGVVIDLVRKQLRFLVVESSRWAGRAQWLIPFSLATIDREHCTLCLDGDSLDSCPTFDPETIAPLQEEESIAG
jgi:hypothetical protein